MQLLFWMMDGLVVSWLMEEIMSLRGRHLLMDAFTGVVGGVGGAFLISSLIGLPVRGKMIYTNIAAMVGAVVVMAASRLLAGRRRYA